MDGKFLITYDENGLYSFYSDDSAEYTINLSTFGTKIVAEEIWESDYPEYYVRDIVDSNLKLKDFVFSDFSESSKTFELEVEDYIISYSSENSFATIGSKKIDYEFFISDGNARIVINGPIEENIQVQLGYYCALPIIEGQSYELTINNETLTEQCKLKNNTLYFGDYVYFLDENEEIEPEEPESETITIDSSLYSSIDSYVTFSSENETKYKIVFYKSGETEKSYLIYSKQLINAETGAASAYVGNLDIYGGGEDTGEPFFIITNQNEDEYESFIYVRESGSYILKVELYALNEVPALAGAALVSFGKKVVDGETESIENNYGIGINSSDQNLTLPQKAISLFETELFKTGANEDKIKFNYRGILGTLPHLSPNKVSDLYNNYMVGTQGIYTDNIYIGDKDQFLSFYTKNGSKELNIQANRLLFNAGGSYTDVAEIEKAVDSKDWLSYKETEDESAIEGKTYYIKSRGPIGENLLIYPYNDTALSPKTIDGITYVDNGDLTITANGTSNKDGSDFKCSGRKPEDMPELILQNGTYWVDGNPIAGIGDKNYTTRINVGVTKNNKWYALVYDYTEDTGVQFEVNGDDFRTDSAKVSVQVAVKNWTTVNNVVFRPRVRVVGDIYNEVTNIESGVNPSEEGWYELKNGSSSISNYVSTHLEMKSDGLYVTKSNSGYKLKLDDLGAYIIDPSGLEVATYSTTVTIGNENLRNVFINDNSVNIREGLLSLASFGTITEDGKQIPSIKIGESDKRRVEITDKKTSFYDRDGRIMAEISQGNEQSNYIQVPFVEGTILDENNEIEFVLPNKPNNPTSGIVIIGGFRNSNSDSTSSNNFRHHFYSTNWPSPGETREVNSDNVQTFFELDSEGNGKIKLKYNGQKYNRTITERTENTVNTAGYIVRTISHPLKRKSLINPEDTEVSEGCSKLKITLFHSITDYQLTGEIIGEINENIGTIVIYNNLELLITYTKTSTDDHGTIDISFKTGYQFYANIEYYAEVSELMIAPVDGKKKWAREVDGIRYYSIDSLPYYSFGTRANGNIGINSLTAGNSLIAGGENQIIFGKYNLNSLENILEIGNGTDESNRKNAVEIKSNGNAIFNGTSLKVNNYEVLHEGSGTKSLTNIEIVADTGYTTPEYIIKQYGKVVTIYLRIQKSTDTSVGDFIFSGTINTINARPFVLTTGIGWFATREFMGWISSQGAIRIKNTSTTSQPAITGGNYLNISFTYLVQ